MALRHVQLQLSHDYDVTNDSDARGYVFVAPLTKDGYLDAEE